ncbi:MAG TPA: hypothetical protein VGX68_00515 [Thermoanaerobaculia bacterium]|jgi:hypothetical protein|nr:hypothetical protein [Thermoanaerobaculia bacterium]
MAKVLSIPDQLTDWEKLVTNVWANREELPDLEMYRGPLEQVLGEAKALDARLQSRVGIKQQETKDRRERMRTGRFCASKLRAALKAHYGYQSERLREYGIKPVRTGKRQPEEPEQPQPDPEAPETQAAPETTEAPKPEGPAPTPQDTASQTS